MESVPIHLSDLGQGICDGIPPIDIGDGQFETLLNFYPFGTKIVRRPGTTRLSTTAAGGVVSGLALFAESSNHYAVAGLWNGFAWNNAGAMTDIPKLDGAFSSDGRPWSITQYKSEMFAVRPGEVLQRLTLASVENAGIAAPAAPVATVDSNNPWTATSEIDAPDGRYRHTTVWTGTKALVWGGRVNGGAFANGGIYDPVADIWIAFPTAGAPPSNRESHSATWCATEMLVWGGTDGTTPTNTGSRYDPATATWTAMTTVGAPVARYGHTAIWSGSRLVVWGGYDGAAYLNSGGIYNPATNTWVAMTGVGAPTGRSGHTAVWSGTRMLAWGGYDSTAVVVRSGGSFDPVGNAWTTINLSGAPDARYVHTAVWTGTKMIVWGGYDPALLTYLSSGGIYDPVADTWAAVADAAAPSPRWYHTAVWTGSKMVVWGGRQGSVNLAAGGVYDPVSDSWVDVATVEQPTARHLHTAIWTGTQMFVWGGYDAVVLPAPTSGALWFPWDGEVTPGEHRYFVTFESGSGNQSPQSEEITVQCENLSIVTVTLPLSTSPRVLQRSLWRSLANDAGQLWRVAVIPDNVTTVYEDKIPDAELGAPFEYGNRLPPTTPCRMIAQWKHRLWLIDEAALYASKTGRFETLDQTFQGFDQYSGHVLRGVCPFDERLVLGTTKKIFGLTQTGVDETGVRFDIEVLSEEHGTVAGMSMAVAEGKLFWFAGDNVYMRDSGEPVSISTIDIRKILDRAKKNNAARWEYAVGSVNTDLGWYMLSLSVDSSTVNDTLLIYNYKSGRWTTFKFFADSYPAGLAPAALLSFYDANYASQLYAGFESGHLFKVIDSGVLADAGEGIFATGRGKAFQKVNASSLFRKFSLNCSSVPEDLTLRLYRDGIATAVNERTVYLTQSPARDWKRIGLSGKRKLARTFQVEFEYTGLSALEINEMIFELDTFEMTRRPI